MADVTLPQLGESVTEGTITKWFKKVGDTVAVDEPLFEVSTDKVDSEVPAPEAGVVTEILVAEGDTVDVGTRLAVISASGSVPAPPAPAPAPETAAPEAPGSSRPAPSALAETPAEPAPAPPAPLASAPAPPIGPVADGIVLSPLVRRLIADNSLDAASITGTGAGGRITREDVLDALDRRKKPVAAAAVAAGPPPVRAAGPVVSVGPRDEFVPFTNIRRRTGEHMVMSKATSPHVLSVVEVDYEGVERIRRSMKDSFKAEEGLNLTYLPFISRAVIDAIAEFPHLNASVGDGGLVVHRTVGLGFAVDLDFQGLIVPVVRDAEGKRLRLMAREIAALASRARNKKLSVDDIQGGTFTITNTGPFGNSITAAVINQPQVAIIATDGISRKPVAVALPDGGESIAIHSVGNLCMSWDHRAFDGAYAAAFLRRVKEIIETRDWATEF